MTGCELYIYVTPNDVRRIELFDDEKISLTSSVQDIADLSRAKTDFSQSFTIPASEHNNAIFKHWYENAVDGGFDQRIRYNGFIEINTIPFRVGGFSLNNVLFNNNRPESYNINFYGRAKNIKDTFKEDNLGSLPIGLNHIYNSANVISYITGSAGFTNLAYPLFAHDRIFQYGGGGNTDVTTNGGSINFTSLFPAVKLSHILNRIDVKYSIKFVGAFVSSAEFERLWILYKNAEVMSLDSEPLEVNFTQRGQGLTDQMVNLATNEIGFSGPGHKGLRITISPSPSHATTVYKVRILRNNVVVNTFENQVGEGTGNIFYDAVPSLSEMNDKYKIQVVSSVNGFTFTSTLRYSQQVFTPFPNNVVRNATGTAQITSASINIQSYAPELKIIDLFSGLVKMFNLVVLPINENTFEIKPLEMYYNDGRINDISDNVIVDSIDIKKTSMYKNINFKYQDSSNLLNNAFNNQATVAERGYHYGNLKFEQIDSLESGTYSVDLPFENPLSSRLGGNFQTITFKDKDLNNYLPKPVLMYDNDFTSVTPQIVMKPTSGHQSIAQYRRFTNDLTNGELLSLNWGEEISSFTINAIENGLYRRHYANYIGNVFSLKGRMLVVKCKFTPLQLSKIQLNDRIIIRDKKYTINKLVAEITSGEATLELLTDFRDPLPQFSQPPVFVVGKLPSQFTALILAGGASEIDLKAPAENFITYPLSVQNDSFNLVVDIAENTTGDVRTGFIIGEWDGVIQQIPIIQDA